MFLPSDLLHFPMVHPAEVALLFPANKHTHTHTHTHKYKKDRINRDLQSVCGVFGRAGGDRQAGEGSRRFDPLHFSLHVYIDVIYFLMLTQQTEPRQLEAGSSY